MNYVKQFLLSVILIAISLPGIAQINCPGALLTDDFSNPSLWTYYGTHTLGGQLNISGGTLNYINYQNRQNYRLLRDVSKAIPNSKLWRIDWEFKETGTQDRVGGMIMTLSSDTLHPRWATQGGNNETIQDVIGVLTGNSNHGAKLPHYFVPMSKYNGTPHAPSNPAFVVYSVGVQYYLRLQRTANDQAVFCAFSDPARTQHIPGSPLCFAIDPRIDDLQYMQIGVHTSAWAQRRFTATQDNICIYDSIIPELCQCNIVSDFTASITPGSCTVTFTDQTVYGPGTTPLANTPIDFGDGSNSSFPPGGSITHTFPAGTSVYHVIILPFGYDSEGNCCRKHALKTIELQCGSIKGKRITTKGGNQGVALFPNPTENRINVRSEKAIHGLRIYDLSGKTILNQTNLNKNVLELDVEALPNGIYFLELNLGDKMLTRKFSKM